MKTKTADKTTIKKNAEEWLMENGNRAMYRRITLEEFGRRVCEHMGAHPEKSLHDAIYYVKESLLHPGREEPEARQINMHVRVYDDGLIKVKEICFQPNPSQSAPGDTLLAVIRKGCFLRLYQSRSGCQVSFRRPSHANSFSYMQRIEHETLTTAKTA